LTFSAAAAILNHMVEDRMSALDGVFHALADPTRRAMLRRLAGGERSVGELAEPFAMTFAAASKHVKVLEQAALVRRQVQGRRHVCRLETAPLATADAWLEFYRGFWRGRLDDLAAALAAEDEASSKGKGQ
jgi:DNA-binding transcriptional ArsR family regulator